MTKKYYEENSKEFIDSTINCDMNETYTFFEKYIAPKSRILDLGFGSGRDSLYFLNKGYDVYSLDPVEAFIEHAKEIGLPHVIKGTALDICMDDFFDAIFACASLLHVEEQKLLENFKAIANSLKRKGILYCSFKYGEFVGERKNRYFVDMNEQNIQKYIKNTGLIIIDQYISSDVRPERKDEKWINFIMRKD